MNPLVEKLTLDEKAGLVSGAAFWTTRPVDRVGIPSITMTDGPHGVRMQRKGEDHLGINASEPATCFPTASLTGSTWNPELLRQMGAALGDESRALDVDILLGPGVNIKRSPLCGRNFEYLSEDPFHAGVLGTAFVQGVQSRGVGSSVKHFAANNQETDRMRVDAQVDERSLREIYFPAFERIVREANPATVMCSYNKVNGTYASQNHWLLTDVLRGDWGFEGYVVSDWGAVVDPVAAVAAGLDLEMPSTGDRSPEAIVAAVRAGTLDEILLDQAVSRVLGVHERLRGSQDAEASADFDAHHALARTIAADGAVLLANEGNLLPLDPSEGGQIAVIGEFARTPRYQGAGSSHVNPTRLDEALTEIGKRSSRPVEFAPGFSFEGDSDDLLHLEAVDLASQSEVVLLFLGLPDRDESEGFDRTHLLIPETQRTLLAKIAAVNANVVVVLSNGGVVTLDSIVGVAPAILEMWLAGQASGGAAADIIFGISEPGGRLAETIPLDLAHTPAHVNWPGENGVVRYGEGFHVGYRWYDATDRPVAFPFGYGLGYTSFSHDDLSVSVADATVAQATVQVTVTNTGQRAGSDVVQVYVTDNTASVARPIRELKAFEKVWLEPGEQRVVTLTLDERSFAFWGPTGWTVEPGAFTIHVGSHSQNLPFQNVITLDVEAPTPMLDNSSTLQEWASHPVGLPVLQGAMSNTGQPADALTNEESLPLFGSMPLRTILGFAQQSAGVSFDIDEALQQLLGAVDDASGVATSSR
ncbi:glycoside hydrolase family 3 C-terminal domain-containing protein [Microbacterium sp. ZXX196]|uniref:glycoside hydrolase family 3 C-terminal domain-containing protein n=1 Tax=Microbacterium sp. ZXX196 TaxID=2609291 RepID=UPI0012B9D594|nr:glycoside hydrolase family 3 C-terminal domain-containing protein [Microbacterium sp. ZXX196]MTE24893.1 beta-glucosidase [Microbacterium sp. ZXX196]